MTFRSQRFALVFAGVILSTLGSVHGQQQPSRRGQRIQFSEPRYGTATSNLNDIATQKMPFQNPGQEFKKPSDIFDAAEESANIITPPLRQLPRPNLTSKRLKELYDKRNDPSLQTPEDLATALTVEKIFKIPEYDRNGQDKEKKSELERAYERFERQQLGDTNQMKGDDLFGRQKENESRSDLSLFGKEKPPGVTDNAPSLTPKALFSGDAGSMFPTDTSKSMNFQDSFGFANLETPEVKRARETRLQNYRQLLESGTVSSPGSTSPGANPVRNAPTVVQGLTPTHGLDSLPGVTPRSSLPATTVGAPLGFPGAGNSQSLTPPSPVRIPLPPPVFEIPKRKF